MNILFTQTAYPPAVGGAQSHLHQICIQLSNRHDIKVVSYWKSNRTDWLLGTTWLAPNHEPYELDGIEVHPLTHSLRDRFKLSPWILGYYLWQRRSIEGIVQYILPRLRTLGRNVDIIHHGRIGREALGYASLQLARELGIPFVITPYHHPRWNNKFYRHYHRLYRLADAVIALTSSEVDTLVRLGIKRERIYITGNGSVLSEQYFPNDFRHKYGINGAVVLFLGQKYSYKGISQILQAAELVWKKHPDTNFVFIGPRTKYSKRVFINIRDPRILELGTVSLEEKTSALAACDLVCVPSTQESFGGVYTEAWMMNKPVIGADIPAVSDVISDGIDGFIGPPEPEFLAERILLLLDNPDLRSRLGSAGRHKAEKLYSWYTLAQKTEEIYDKLLNKEI